MKKILSFFLAVLSCAVYAYPAVSTGTSLLKTPHFIIRYNQAETPYAAAIAEQAESHYKTIESFLSYSFNDDITISISGINSSFFSTEINSLKISSVSNFRNTDEELYRQIFMRFLDHISQKSSGLLKLKVRDDIPMEMLCNYSITGLDVNNELILRDYLLNSSGKKLNIRELNELNDNTVRALYAGFFNYLDSVYGRKVVLRAVKDICYYGSFFTSLSFITGISFEDINTGFNEFLAAKFYGYLSYGNPGRVLYTPLNGSIKDFFINENKLAALVNNGDCSSIDIIDISTGNLLLTKELYKGPDFESISLVNNQIAVAGNNVDGSSIYIFNMEHLLLENEMQFPGIYINTINNSGNIEKVYLNAFGSISGSILDADFKSGILKKISVERLSEHTNIIYLNESIYYITKNDYYELTEYNIRTGKKNQLLKTKDEIVSLTDSGNNIVLAANSLSGGYVSFLNAENGNLKKTISGSPPVYKAFISDEIIYMLSYYNGGRRVIVKEIPR